MNPLEHLGTTAVEIARIAAANGVTVAKTLEPAKVPHVAKRHHEWHTAHKNKGRHHISRRWTRLNLSSSELLPEAAKSQCSQDPLLPR